MSMRIITGSTGTTHVTSNDDGCYNQAVWGKDSIILGTGEKLKASIVDNNTVLIEDGDILLQGRHARINPGTTEEVKIATGSVGTNRNDLIVARYELDDTTGYEDISLVVIEGTEASGAAADPVYNQGDIRTGAILVDFPLYRVKIEGINITSVELLAKVQEGFADAINEINNNLNHFQLREVDGKAQYKLESEGADAWRFFKKAPTKIEQTLTVTNSSDAGRTGNLTFVFNKLTRIDGISAMSISPKSNNIGVTSIDITNNQVKLIFYNSKSSGTLSISSTITAFMLEE